ncbi:tyrosine phosphatase family protein [Nitratireductor sp. ZSWI3]|uniref:tyrosine phosphatase family protein n=1 Tax=Nitratireductor sp. ZSWI3 TaxID=2966359 RepID=UPI00214FF113|nr:tyrosine protein phosphatase [Nitratireductor sp. ZSWI3]MCR4269016.1 tyrosine protein phosphatase [Nitratireductor sp. ZSWI3]
MLYVCPQSQLERTVKAVEATHLISLTSSEMPPPHAVRLPKGNRLHLSMHDINEQRPGLVAPSLEHVEALLAFARDWDCRSPLVVHCHAGISRSTAAAYVIAATLARETDEAELARILRARAPSATPNRRIVALADALLERQGRMVRAILSIGRGEEAFEGRPFHLPVR